MKNQITALVLTATALLGTAFGSSAQAALPYALMIDVQASPPEARLPITNALLYFVFRDLSRAAQEISGEDVGGMAGTKVQLNIADPSNGDKLGPVVSDYNPTVPFKSPVDVALRTGQRYESYLKDDLRYVEAFMTKFGGKQAREPESGAQGIFPTSAKFRLKIVPWDVKTHGPMPTNAQPILEAGANSVAPIGGILKGLTAIPYFLLGVQKLAFFPMPADLAADPAKLRALEFDGFRAAVSQDDDALNGIAPIATLSEVSPKGITAEISLASGDPAQSQSYSYLTLLIGRVRKIQMPFISDPVGQPVHIRTFKFDPQAKKTSTAIELNLFSSLKPGVIPYATVTIGQLQNQPAQGGPLGATGSPSDLRIAPAATGNLPTFGGTAGNSGIQWSEFLMHFERLVLTLQPTPTRPAYSLLILNPADPTTVLRNNVHTSFHYAGVAFGVALPTAKIPALESWLTNSKVGPGISGYLETMMPK